MTDVLKKSLGKESARRPGFDSWVGKIPWRRKWQPTPEFLHRISHGQRGLAGYSPWGHKQSDVTERLSTRGQNVMLHCLDVRSNDISTDQDRKDKG